MHAKSPQGRLNSPPPLLKAPESHSYPACVQFSQCWMCWISPRRKCPGSPNSFSNRCSNNSTLKGSFLFQVAPAVSDPEMKFILCSCRCKSFPRLQAKAAAAEGLMDAQGVHSCCPHPSQPRPVGKTPKCLKIPWDCPICNS